MHHVGEVGLDLGLGHVDDFEAVLDQDLVAGNEGSGLFLTVIAFDLGEKGCDQLVAW